MNNLPAHKNQKSENNRNHDDILVLLAVLIMATILGSFWVGLIAAWDHHDEPNHFQYIRMLYDKQKLPQPGDENFKLNRQILKSMIWNGFFERFGFEPLLPPPRQPTYLPGYSQYPEPPLYYYLASIGVAALQSENITRQMFGARLISFFLYLLSIFAAWGLMRDLTLPGNPLRWMVPISMTFLPGFVDIMTAVNNDSGAIALTSFFLWASARLVKRGFSWFDFFGALSLAVLSIFMKSTAMVCIILLPFVFILSILRGKWQWFVWIVCGITLLVALPFLIDNQDAAFFYRSSGMVEPSRVQNPQAVLGDWVLQINQSIPSTPPWMSAFFQPIPLDTSRQHLGETITLGVWMWSNKEMTAQTPELITETEGFSNTVQLSNTPAFFIVEGRLNNKIPRLWVSFNLEKNILDDTYIYYDGMVLADGERPIDEIPIYNDNNAESGLWGDSPFDNMLRNGSVEIPGLRISPKLDQLAPKVIPDQIRPSFILSSLLDPSSAGYYYKIAFERVFLTFWGYFGWGHIPLSQTWLYSFALFATIIAIAGAGISLVRNWNHVPWNIFFIFALALSITGFATIIRGVIYLSFQNMFFPVARYLMPLIIPIIIILCSGWYEISLIIRKITNRFLKHRPLEQPGAVSWISFTLFSITWLIFVILAIMSILFYYGGYPLFF